MARNGLAKRGCHKGVDMRISIAFLMILSGIWLDVSDAIFTMPFEVWQGWYSIVRDIQFVGFSLLAFELCPYNGVEIKMATFFMLLWRVVVFGANALETDPGKAIWSVAVLTVVYLSWMARAILMGHIDEEEEKPGAYMFLMPIHSGWGLLKAIFMPWEMARYESVVMVDDGTAWFVHRWKFTQKHVCDTNLIDRQGVKRYLGRPLNGFEKMRLVKLVGTRAIPGLRDCRKFKI